MLIVYLIFFGLIVLFFVFITPTIIDSAKNLIKELPNYIEATQKWLSSLPSSIMDKYGIIQEIEGKMDEALVKATESLAPLLNKTLTQVVNFTSGFFNFIMGSIISIYVLKDKEQFNNGFKKLNYAMFSKEKAESIISAQNDIKSAFSRFFAGKFIDSLIIGIMCFIGCLILKVPFATLISVIFGITNMIPYFGPFVGVVIATLVTLFDSPIKALWVLIFTFALQQFDGLYLGPKILGIQVGMKPFWIITALLIGGGFFGVWGMLFAVPIAAVIKIFVERYIENQYKIKGLKKE